jgi:hypothetical protein
MQTNSTGIDYDLENVLALRWKLLQTTVTYDGLRFDIHFTVSDYISEDLVLYTLYDGPECSSGANIITDTGYFNSWITGDNTPLGGGLLTRQITFSTTIVPENITQSTTYEEIGTDANIEFCVRFSLYSQDATDPAAYEINYLETTVALMVDLTDNFAISTQLVEARDKGENTAEDAFFIEGFICTSEGIPPADTIPFLQGQTVKVCIQPTQQALDLGFRMRWIERFTFVQGYITQEAIINRKPSINGLAEVWCEEGSTQCMFETLLMAYFFRGPSTVSGNGEATLQFGPAGVRRLRSGNRDLKETSKTVEVDLFGVRSINYVLQPAYSGAKRVARHFWALILIFYMLILIM